MKRVRSISVHDRAQELLGSIPQHSRLSCKTATLPVSEHTQFKTVLGPEDLFRRVKSGGKSAAGNEKELLEKQKLYSIVI